MMVPSRRKVIQTLSAVSVSAVLAGCSGGGDDGDGTSTPEETDTPTPEETDTPTPEETPTPTPEETDTPTPEETDTPTPDDREASFELGEVIVTDLVESGEPLEAWVTVQNSGGPGEATVQLALGDEQREETVEVGAEASEEISTEFATDAIGAGRYDLSAELGDMQATETVDVLAPDGPGIYGSILTPNLDSQADLSLQAFGFKNREFEQPGVTLDDNGHFSISHPYELEYRYQVYHQKSELEYGKFDGVPLVYGLAIGPVNDEVLLTDQYEVPRGYKTQIQLVDESGEPLEDFSPVNIRDATTGTGFGSREITTDGDGYVMFDRSREPGISAPADEDAGLNVVARVESDEFEEDTFGMVYGSEESEREEFVFTVSDPDKYEVPESAVR